MEVSLLMALNSFWSFPYIGLSDQGVPKFAIIDQTPGTKTRVESGTLLDYMIYSGVKDPVFSGGLSTSFRYKQFTLSASFNFQLGHHKRLNPFMRSQATSGGIVFPTQRKMQVKNSINGGDNRVMKNTRIYRQYYLLTRIWQIIFRTIHLV